MYQSSLYRARLGQMALAFRPGDMTADELVAENSARTSALARLAKLPTVKERGKPISVKAPDLFQQSTASVRVPLNVKTTQNERKTIPVAGLEPTQEKIPVDGLRAYVSRSRRDPPDVLHIVMNGGKERWLIQEGHTRVGAALLRGKTDILARVWEFIETPAGEFVPVPRGLQKRGLDRSTRALSYREKLALLLGGTDIKSIQVLDRAGKPIGARIDFPEKETVISLPMGEYADFDDCVSKNQDKDSPEGYCAVIHKAINGAWPGDDVINLPDISDVSFPTMVGAIKEKGNRAQPRRRKKKVNYRGVVLSRRPMKFEAQILALAEIPSRLDAAVFMLTEKLGSGTREVMQDIATYGSVQVLHELVRQGASASILTKPPVVDVEACWKRVDADRTLALNEAMAYCEARVARRKLNADRHKQIVRLLFDRREPRILKRFANRAVNDAFTFGRAVTIDAARRPRLVVSLAKKNDDDEFDDTESDTRHAQRGEGGRFESIIDAVNAGEIAVDVVVQTAVMDTATCDECEEVDGEEMELGDDRQIELHPPYVKCLGEDNCRCLTPDTPVWMGNFSYRAIGDVKVGDAVIGWRQRTDDDPWQQPSARAYQRQALGVPVRFTTAKLVRTTVTHVTRLRDRTRTLLLASGASVRCTDDHQWLARRGSHNFYDFVEAREITPGIKLARVVGDVAGPCPPELRETAAWLGGVYDGEGSGMGFSQSETTADGAVVQAIIDACARLGFDASLSIENERQSGRKGRQVRVRLNGGRATAVKFALWVPSVRFRAMYADPYILTSRFRALDLVVAVEEHPEPVDVMCLTTKTGNFVADGLCSHNCVQIAILENGMEIDVDEIDEDTIA